jgi:hypothetical protein
MPSNQIEYECIYVSTNKSKKSFDNTSITSNDNQKGSYQDRKIERVTNPTFISIITRKNYVLNFMLLKVAFFLWKISK